MSFDKEDYPRILLSKGWRSSGPMDYTLADCRIFFDTSSQFQIVKGDEVIGSYAADSEEKFVAILDELDELRGLKQIEPALKNTRPAVLLFTSRKENKWIFSDGSGGTLITDIEDKEFLNRVNRHEITFGKGDELHVVLRTKTFRYCDQLYRPGRLRTEHTIVKVLQFLSSSQLKLFGHTPSLDS